MAWRANYEIPHDISFDSGNAGGAMNKGIMVVRDRRNGMLCIRKRIGDDDIPSGIANREAELLYNLDHPYINKILDSEVEEENGKQLVTITLKFCTLGSLDTFIARVWDMRRGVPEPFAWHVFKQVARALAYIHFGINEFKNQGMVPNWDGVIHRDMKPGNIFIDHDPTSIYPRFVLGDFGCATTMGLLATSPKEKRLLERGTKDFLPPEFLYYDRKGDVWALAMCMLELIGVREPAGGSKNSNRNPPLDGASCSRELKKCIEGARMWHKQDRWHSADLVANLSDEYKKLNFGTLRPLQRDFFAEKLWKFVESQAKQAEAQSKQTGSQSKQTGSQSRRTGN